MKDQAECAQTPEHEVHMLTNGECPWCGASDPSQATATIEDDGTIRAEDGTIIEHGAGQ